MKKAIFSFPNKTPSKPRKWDFLVKKCSFGTNLQKLEKHSNLNIRDKEVL